MAESQGPQRDERGLYLKHGDLEFRTMDQLPEEKRRRFKHYKIKPIEKLTIPDLERFNRDQLRAYCYIYGLPRTRKLQMESDMIRHVAAWHHGEPEFDVTNYKFANHPDGLPPLSNPAEVLEKRAKANRASRRARASLEASALKDTSFSGQRSSRRHSEPAFGKRKSAQDGELVPTSNLTASGRPLRRRRPSRRRFSHEESQSSRKPATARPLFSSPRPAFKSASKDADVHEDNETEKETLKRSLNLDLDTKKKRFAGGVGQTPAPGLKHKLHEEQAGAKFKAAYNGAGPLMVKIVENAASYLEGKETPQQVEDKKISLERYQFNVNLLKELFEAGMDDECNEENEMEVDEPKEYTDLKKRIDQAITEKMTSRSEQGGRDKEIAEMEKNLASTLQNTGGVEKINIRPFRRLERAKTAEEIATARAHYEKEHSVTFEDAPPPVLKVDLSLAGNELDKMENAFIVRIP